MGCREWCDTYRWARRVGAAVGAAGGASCAGDRAPSLSDEERDDGGVGGRLKPGGIDKHLYLSEL